ncbi:MAG: IgA Peptidase M64 [Bacteroidales bacterium]|nr:IgA Peptidase M64 [Bacteroidales bacterium]
MRHFTTFLFLILSFSVKPQNSYFDYFTDNSMRIDFVFAGNAVEENIYLDKIIKEPFWGGSKINLTDKFDYGEYKFEVFDNETNTLIFSKGFCTLFEEWQTTNEAKLIDKSFNQTITFPYPLKTVALKIYSRKWEGDFEKIFEMNIDPGNYFINPERSDFTYVKAIDNGDPAKKVDLVFLAEGYTESEMDKFVEDSERLIKYMFSQEPYNKYKDRFNIWLVKSVSKESGTDIPGERLYKKTIINSNFYTFDSERYLTTMDVQKVRDIASVVPYDDICILVNSEKYGGGGIYNHYCISTVDNSLSDKVFIHELGHSFAGLGDEYYNSVTSYNDFFNLEIEPWQPNLTTMVDFNQKWKNMITEDIPIPTLRDDQFKNVIGVFEGGGYVNKGMFSPFMDCRMNNNEAEGFCPVCKEAIIKMILFKSE